MKLLVATRNTHKLKEIQAIFQIPGLVLLSMADFPDCPEVVEDGATFVVNAIKKAVTVARATRLWAMADDSGLEVEALDGAPGVMSARYAGEPVNYSANNARLIDELRDVRDRRACFRCVIALASPTGRSQIVEGRCDGQILVDAHGVNGFGYDPLFVPEGYPQTFAEMADDLKNTISHRAKALKLASEKWDHLLRSPADTPEWI